MFATRFFANRYFAPRYFPKTGGSLAAPNIAELQLHVERRLVHDLHVSQHAHLQLHVATRKEVTLGR